MPLICISSVVQCLVLNTQTADVTIINPHNAQTDQVDGINNVWPLPSILCT